jgi:Tfp pilus assembly protein PilO
MFFDRISKFPRIINVSELSIKAKTEPSANSTITAECTATTFVLLDQSKVPVKPRPGAPGAARPGAPGAPRTGN